jgi:hypothetical protein
MAYVITRIQNKSLGFFYSADSYNDGVKKKHFSTLEGKVTVHYLMVTGRSGKVERINSLLSPTSDLPLWPFGLACSLQVTNEVFQARKKVIPDWINSRKEIALQLLHATFYEFSANKFSYQNLLEYESDKKKIIEYKKYYNEHSIFYKIKRLFSKEIGETSVCAALSFALSYCTYPVSWWMSIPVTLVFIADDFFKYKVQNKNRIELRQKGDISKRNRYFSRASTYGAMVGQIVGLRVAHGSICPWNLLLDIANLLGYEYTSDREDSLTHELQAR